MRTAIAVRTALEGTMRYAETTINMRISATEKARIQALADRWRPPTPWSKPTIKAFILAAVAEWDKNHQPPPSKP